MKPITILLADDHTVVREGIGTLLESEPDLRVVGEAKDGREAVILAKRLRPAVVLMDIAMPRLNGLAATREVLKAVPSTKVLMLSAHRDDAYIREATDAGAAGFLLKQTSAQIVCQAIREVHQGHSFFWLQIAKRLPVRERKSPVRSLSAQPPRAASLTSRELEVLQMIATGRTNKATGTELGLSSRTIEKYREKVMAKLDIHDTAGLTRYAVTAGIIETSVQLTII